MSHPSTFKIYVGEKNTTVGVFTGAHIAHHLDPRAPSTPMAGASQASSQRLGLQEEVFDCSDHGNKPQTASPSH